MNNDDLIELLEKALEITKKNSEPKKKYGDILEKRQVKKFFIIPRKVLMNSGKYKWVWLKTFDGVSVKKFCRQHIPEIGMVDSYFYEWEQNV